MSVYERRFEVHVNRCSHYTNDPADALAFYNRREDSDSHPAWIAEGYPVYSDGPNDTLCVTRRQIGPVLPSTLEFLTARAEVRKLLNKE